MSDLESQLARFHATWPLSRIESMSLAEYTNIDDPDTFCRWVERETNDLGSIKGSPSDKFGLWRLPEPKAFKKLLTDGRYAWAPKHGDTADAALHHIKELILDVVQAAKRMDLEAIDAINLQKWWKWKIAILSSNARIPPLYKESVLEAIAKTDDAIQYEYGRSAPILYHVLETMPPGATAAQYGLDLFNTFNTKKDAPNSNRDMDKQRRKYRERVIDAKQDHRKMQAKLCLKLKQKYPDALSIEPEANYVDVLLRRPHATHLYEIKTSHIPALCIREAIGQLLQYSLRFERHAQSVALVVVGPSPMTHKDDQAFLEYVQELISIPLTYERCAP